MRPSGDSDLLIAARRALLDALDALREHRDSVVLIGAQAIYLHTGAATVALAEATKDSDLALDARSLGDRPLLEEAMSRAGFRRNQDALQPGSWLSPDGTPVDLMVPEALAGRGGRRGARIPPHATHAARRATGLEAAVVDYVPMHISALEPSDTRSFFVNVASPAALLVAKLHKLGESAEQPDRLTDKDAHDLYRLLVGIPTGEFAAALGRLRRNPLASDVTKRAMKLLAELFADGPDAVGSAMAGRAEQGVGDPETVSAAAATLAADLLLAVESAERIE